MSVTLAYEPLDLVLDGLIVEVIDMLLLIHGCVSDEKNGGIVC